jgi:hypothetical protein
VRSCLAREEKTNSERFILKTMIIEELKNRLFPTSRKYTMELFLQNESDIQKLDVTTTVKNLKYQPTSRKIEAVIQLTLRYPESSFRYQNSMITAPASTWEEYTYLLNQPSDLDSIQKRINEVATAELNDIKRELGGLFRISEKSAVGVDLNDVMDRIVTKVLPEKKK